LATSWPLLFSWRQIAALLFQFRRVEAIKLLDLGLPVSLLELTS
jgi:hypothetical protein